MEAQKKTKLIKECRDYVMIGIAMMSYAIGWTIFLLPNNITTGGVPGISSIVFWGLGIPVQWSYFAINILLLAIALKILGWRFCVKTIYGVFVLTLLTNYSRQYLSDVHLLADQPFMASIIGAIFCGSGVGLGLASNGSTGGTDIIAAIVHKYYDITLGRVIMLVDIVIITSSYLVLRNWEQVLYGYVVLYVTAFCIDQVVGMQQRNVQFFIISEKYKEIASQIAIYPHRGATVIEAYGFHTGREVKMLFIMAKRRESRVIFQLINDIDPNAFVTQSYVQGVYGEGFDKFKVHSSKKPAPLNDSQLGNLSN